MEFTELLPPPPEVIIINDEEVTPIPLTSQLPTRPKLEPPAAPLLTSEKQSHIQPPSHYPSCVCHLPQHLAYDYLFTTVAKECKQPPEHPYHTAGGTVVDLAIKDEYLMAQVCHYVMTHTANTLYCAQDIKPKKKQYSLKADLKASTNHRGKKLLLKSLPNSTLSNVSCHVTHLHYHETSVNMH